MIILISHLGGGKESCVIKDASLTLSSVFSLKPNTLIQEEHISNTLIQEEHIYKK